MFKPALQNLMIVSLKITPTLIVFYSLHSFYSNSFSISTQYYTYPSAFTSTPTCPFSGHKFPVSISKS